MRLVASERKSLLPLRLRPTTVTVGSRPSLPMPTVTENNNKPSLTVGSRVLVNGLKGGTLRYIGTVQFAQGTFCGVELDQPDGKHDGAVKDVRYFQCESNHGVFVPQDKVVPAARPRASSSQRIVSRLKPPTLTRSITLTSSINKMDQSKFVQLPDIVPNATTQPVPMNEPLVTDNHTIIQSIEQPEVETPTKVEFSPLPTEEPVETIEVDFTDSVSLILHQLQQEQQQQIETHSSSITISEEDSDEETDDNESIVESTTNESLDKTRHSSVSSVFIPADLTKSAQTDVSFHSNDNVSFSKIEVSNKQLNINKKDEQTNINKKKPIVQPVKRNIERRPTPSSSGNIIKRPATNIVARKPSIIPSKKGPTLRSKLNSAQSVTSLTSQSKLSLSLSSSNSLNSSHSDLASINKSTPSKQATDTTENVSHSAAYPSLDIAKKLEESHHNLHRLEQELLGQKKINESLQITNEHLQKSYQYLLNKFDLMHILSQYYIDENERVKQQHDRQLSQARTRKDQLKMSIERLQSTHKNELMTIDKQYQTRMETLNKTHEQQLNESEQKSKHLLNEKNEVDARCLVLQEKVDSFLTEMANSTHADVLLCHVETLEKDRTSLQSVLELKNKEITQLRTKLHEQETQLTDQRALRKRVDMAENRNQDLECLLRQKQLSEKAAVIERDELREHVTQLERDNGQLKFENETLRYRLRERSFSVSMISDKPATLPVQLNPISPQERPVRDRTYSISSTMLITQENERITRSLSSLNCILNR